MTGLFENQEVPVCPRCAYIIASVDGRFRSSKRPAFFSSTIGDENIRRSGERDGSREAVQEAAASHVAGTLSTAMSSVAAPLADFFMQTKEEEEGEKDVEANQKNESSTGVSLRVMLAEEMERNDLLHKSYLQDVESLAEEKLKLSQKVEELQCRVNELENGTVCLIPPSDISGERINSDGAVHLQARGSSAEPEEPNEQRAAAKIYQLTTLLEKERRNREKLESEMRQCTAVREEALSGGPPHPSCTGEVGGERPTQGCTVRSPLTEKELARWDKELHEKEVLISRMFECIKRREKQLQDLMERMERRATLMTNFFSEFLSTRRLLLAGEETYEDECDAMRDEVVAGVTSDWMIGKEMGSF